jgi:cytochrome c oxidase subunit 1/cytochrome c oxidase subunit I+III
MTFRAELDAGRLPDVDFSTKSPIWWGQLGMMVIEGTIILILIAGFFYTRMGFDVWPPPRIPPMDIVVPTIITALLLVSCIPMRISEKAAVKGEMGKAALYLAIGCVFALVILALRWRELVALPFKWTTDIFGTYAWCLIGLHTMHLIADTLESIVIFVILKVSRVGGKQQTGVEVDGLYWYFVVLIWLPIYASIYLYSAASK